MFLGEGEWRQHFKVGVKSRSWPNIPVKHAPPLYISQARRRGKETVWCMTTYKGETEREREEEERELGM